MAMRLWHFLINPFLVATLNNFKKALVLGADHQAKLLANQADPVIAAIKATFDPVWNSFKATDLNLRIALGDYKGETQTVEELFELLNTDNLPDWETAVHVEYRKGTPPETALFPQGRKPFQSGTYESRIQEIEVLGEKCALIVPLQALSVIILAFHVQIESARQLQQSSGEGQVAALRTLRETARVSMCTSMFGNLGLLLNHYQTNPVEVSNYFDLTLLRKKTGSSAKDITASGQVTHAQTGDPVVNAAVKFVLPDNAIVTTQTDANGDFEADLGEHDDTINVTVQVSAPGFITFSEGGPAEPGEDVVVNVQLEPTPVPPTP